MVWGEQGMSSSMMRLLKEEWLSVEAGTLDGCSEG